MSKFGWSYPAGCSGPPDDGGEPHPKSEEAWSLLEAAGVEESVIEQVCKIIDDLAIEAARECPYCVEAQAKAVFEAELQFDNEFAEKDKEFD